MFLPGNVDTFSLKQKLSKSIKPLSRKADLKFEIWKNTLKIYIFYYKISKKKNFENPKKSSEGML